MQTYTEDHFKPSPLQKTFKYLPECCFSAHQVLWGFLPLKQAKRPTLNTLVMCLFLINNIYFILSKFLVLTYTMLALVVNKFQTWLYLQVKIITIRKCNQNRFTVTFRTSYWKSGTGKFTCSLEQAFRNDFFLHLCLQLVTPFWKSHFLFWPWWPHQEVR